jgi:glutathione peroxidase
MTQVYDFSAKKSGGAEVPLSEYRGKVLLIVNVASKCGYTPQYTALEELYKKYGPKGFEILAFPCNQFGFQEPGNDAEIAQFCTLNFGVTFPLFSKIEVNGTSAHPLFAHLKKSAPGLLGTEMIKWNFTKFLVDKEGSIVGRFAPKDEPAELEEKIKALLGIGSA